MKDVTSTSFGLAIAFILPGFVALYCLTFWSPGVKDLFGRFMTSQSSIRLFLLLVLAALATGLQLTAVRWVLYESWRRRSRLSPTNFAGLGSSADKLGAFRATADEHYRYHQFWGGMSVVMPFLYWGLSGNNCSDLPLACGWKGLCIFSVMEAVTIWAAVEAYRNCVSRAKQIMKGETNA